MGRKARARNRTDPGSRGGGRDAAPRPRGPRGGSAGAAPGTNTCRTQSWSSSRTQRASGRPSTRAGRRPSLALQPEVDLVMDGLRLPLVASGRRSGGSRCIRGARGRRARRSSSASLSPAICAISRVSSSGGIRPPLAGTDCGARVDAAAGSPAIQPALARSTPRSAIGHQIADRPPRGDRAADPRRRDAEAGIRSGSAPAGAESLQRRLGLVEAVPGRAAIASRASSRTRSGSCHPPEPGGYVGAHQEERSTGRCVPRQLERV